MSTNDFIAAYFSVILTFVVRNNKIDSEKSAYTLFDHQLCIEPLRSRLKTLKHGEAVKKHMFLIHLST